MKKSTVIIMWGVITALVNAIYYQVLDVADSPVKSLRYISWILIFAGLLIGTLQYRNKANEGYISFGEAYKVGILMTLIIAVISTVNLAIFLQMHPGFEAKMIAQEQAAMVNKGMTSDQINTAMGIAKKFISKPVMIIFALFGGVISGAIMSLLSSGISSKTKPVVAEEDTNPTIE